MGCHTWFSNKISSIPKEHIKVLREKCIKDIKNYWIYRTSRDKYLAEMKADLEEEKKDPHQDKMWIASLTKMSDPKYYDKQKKKYKEEIELLENNNTPKDKLFKIFSRESTLFDEDIENGYYDLGRFGYHNNYRVWGYPREKFYDAESAIKFLEDYDNNKIACDYTEGMCDEIREIIRKFFKEYPNGRISYG